MENIKETTLLVPGGRGKLWSDIIQAVWWEFANVIVGYHGKKPESWESYQIWKLDELDLPGNVLALVTTTALWVEKSLKEMSWIPTIVASTGYDPDILKNYLDRSLLVASNLSPTIFEIPSLLRQIQSCEWIKIEVKESHHSGKKDYSGTAKEVWSIIVEKWWQFEVDESQYNAEKWISDLWSVKTYRGKDSQEYFAIADQYMRWHAYHRYSVSLDLSWVKDKEKAVRNFYILQRHIAEWNAQHQVHNSVHLSVWFDNTYSDRFDFWHYVNGRQVYADWLLEVAPWFLSQETWQFSMTDYIKHRKTLWQDS